jgi:hypothetical protein
MSWKQAQNSELSNRAAALAGPQPVDELHQRVGHVARVVQAPVDHERREKELEQQREPGLFGGGRQAGLQGQSPGLPGKHGLPRARRRLPETQPAQAQALQEYERLGMQPGMTCVERNQHHDVQGDQRDEQRVNSDDGVDPEHAELPLALQVVAVEPAQFGDDPVREAYESERRKVVCGEAPAEQ